MTAGSCDSNSLWVQEINIDVCVLRRCVVCSGRNDRSFSGAYCLHHQGAVVLCGRYNTNCMDDISTIFINMLEKAPRSADTLTQGWGNNGPQAKCGPSQCPTCTSNVSGTKYTFRYQNHLQTDEVSLPTDFVSFTVRAETAWTCRVTRATITWVSWASGTHKKISGNYEL
jgi:hypothetical protein